jgi:hypothetical protein
MDKKIDILTKEVVEMKSELKELRKYNEDIVKIPESFIIVSITCLT